MLGHLARAGRDDRPARRRGGHAQRADEGRPQVRQDLGRRCAHWEELTGEAAPKPTDRRPSQRRSTPLKPAIAVPRKPAITIPPQAGDRHSTEARNLHPVAATRAGRRRKGSRRSPAQPPLDDTEIDLADLVDCAGAARPHDPVPVPRRDKAEHADLSRSLLLLRLRRLRRSCRLAGAGRGPGIRPGARHRRQLGRPGHPAIANAATPRKTPGARPAR